MDETLPVPARDDPARAPDRPGAAVDLLGAWLDGRRPATLRAYRKDLADFAAFLGAADAAAAVARLVDGDAATAHALVLGYRAHLGGRGLAPATIARRLAALRSMVRLARTLGRTTWTLDVAAPRTTAYRDTRGPGLEGWRALLAAARARGATPRAKRDLALLRLLHDLGLRRGEVTALDLADLDAMAGTLAVVAKGTAEPVRVTLNAPAAAALADWVAARGDWPGPLFVRLDRAAGPGRPGRLDPGSVARITHALGRRAGLSRGTHPHGLRHQGITRALDLAGGDVRRVRRFSRHARIETLLRYDDNRRDDGGALAHLLGADSA